MREPRVSRQAGALQGHHTGLSVLFKRSLPSADGLQLPAIQEAIEGYAAVFTFVEDDDASTAWPLIHASELGLSEPVDGLGSLYLGRRRRGRRTPGDGKQWPIQHAQELAGVGLSWPRQRREQGVQIYLDRYRRLPLHIAQLACWSDPDPENDSHKQCVEDP